MEKSKLYPTSKNSIWIDLKGNKTICPLGICLPYESIIKVYFYRKNEYGIFIVDDSAKTSVNVHFGGGLSLSFVKWYWKSIGFLDLSVRGFSGPKGTSLLIVFMKEFLLDKDD